MIPSGMAQRDERKQTTDDVSKAYRRCQNRGEVVNLGQVWGERGRRYMEVENPRPSLGIRTAKPLQPVKGCGSRPYPLKNFWRNLPCSRGGRTIAASPTGRHQMKAR